jgi:hypothetical protein
MVTELVKKLKVFRKTQIFFTLFKETATIPILSQLSLFDASFMSVSCLSYSSNMEMEPIFSSETSANLHRTTLRYIPEEDRTLQLNPVYIFKFTFFKN